MPKHYARQVLNNPNPTTADIQNAIALLETDIAYIERSQVSNPAGDLGSSLRESRALLWELQLKLNSQSK